MRSAQWTEKRKARRKIDRDRCTCCGEDGSHYRLEVHHRYDGPPYFFYPKPLGEEDIEHDLLTLCADCHTRITDGARARRPNKTLPKVKTDHQKVYLPAEQKARQIPEVQAVFTQKPKAAGISKMSTLPSVTPERQRKYGKPALSSRKELPPI